MNVAERLWWALLVKKCRGCNRCDHHKYDLTLLGRLRYAPWIAIDR